MNGAGAPAREKRLGERGCCLGPPLGRRHTGPGCCGPAWPPGQCPVTALRCAALRDLHGGSFLAAACPGLQEGLPARGLGQPRPRRRWAFPKPCGRPDAQQSRAGLATPKVGAGLPDVPAWPGDARRALRGPCEEAGSGGVRCQAPASVSNRVFTAFAPFRDLSPPAAFWCPRPRTRAPRGPRAARKPDSVPKSRGGLSVRSASPPPESRGVRAGLAPSGGRSGGRALSAPGSPPLPHPAPRAARFSKPLHLIS